MNQLSKALLDDGRQRSGLQASQPAAAESTHVRYLQPDYNCQHRQGPGAPTGGDEVGAETWMACCRAPEDSTIAQGACFGLSMHLSNYFSRP